MTFGSLFAGIGGFDLGLERAGMTCAWQVEIDDYARRVLERHWPDVRRWDDVRTFPPPDGKWGIDLICGGFPCQDVSDAGTRSGIGGRRSGLWSEFARITRLLQPRYVLVENVAGLLVRGMDRVLGDLSSLGYDAEWEVISAESVGAPHIRERVWIVGYPKRSGLHGDNGRWPVQEPSNRRPELADTECDRLQGTVVPDTRKGTTRGRRRSADQNGPILSDSSRKSGLPQRRDEGGCFEHGTLAAPSVRETFPDTQSLCGKLRKASGERQGRLASGCPRSDWWAVEPDVGRVAYGIPARVDRLRSLGNAVVPQIAEYLGRAIMTVEQKGGVP